MPVAERDPDRLFGIRLRIWEGVSYIVTVFGAFGLLFAVYQYHAAGEAERSKETLALIEIWETRAYSAAFDRLRHKVTEFTASVPDADLDIARNSVQAADNLRRKMYGQVLANPDARADLDKVVYFFNRLGLCVQANLCSFRTAFIFFKDPLEGFMSNFSNYITARQEELPGYANGLLLLEKQFSKE